MIFVTTIYKLTRWPQTKSCLISCLTRKVLNQASPTARARIQFILFPSLAEELACLTTALVEAAMAHVLIWSGGARVWLLEQCCLYTVRLGQNCVLRETSFSILLLTKIFLVYHNVKDTTQNEDIRIINI